MEHKTVCSSCDPMYHHRALLPLPLSLCKLIPSREGTHSHSKTPSPSQHCQSIVLHLATLIHHHPPNAVSQSIVLHLATLKHHHPPNAVSQSIVLHLATLAQLLS